MVEPIYIHLPPGSIAPELDKGPFKAVVVISAEVSNDWRNDVSTWLVESGCLYMMAWGIDCSVWDDSVDWANLEKFDFEDIPDGEFVMTTWHDDESLESAFWFAKFSASHGVVDLNRTLILDVAVDAREREMVDRYRRASCDD